MPIFFGFSLETMIVASLRKPEMRTGRALKAGKSDNDTVSESLPSCIGSSFD